jgi:phosphoenolpyruvate carboxykinase (GTP)
MKSAETPTLRRFTKNKEIDEWIASIVDLCTPDHVHLCTGSSEENEALLSQMVHSGTCKKLNDQLRPNSYYFLSDPKDVARVEERTFICTETEDEAGPTNHFQPKEEMKQTLNKLFKNSMTGRTLYIIPFCMGPLHSPISHMGIELTDSPYVVVNMRIMTHMGEAALQAIQGADFVRCLHSVGAPLENNQKDVPWPCNADNKYIVHYPEEREIYSYGSGYGGNALLGKKSFALRIASYMGKTQGWLAEHMLIMGITNPQGEKKYFAASFPSSCGKTNLAMLTPTLPGWKIETVGDDIAWMKFAKDGKLYAINPEAGFFGVAPGTSYKSNPHAMECLKKNSLFTNVAYTEEGDVWWEGMTENAPENLVTWQGEKYQKGMQAAHPNARFTSRAAQCPIIDPSWQDPNGVPISAIIFGGRRSTTIPLVYESFNWQHGVFLGASVSSETTAAAAGEVGKLRHDPFSMLPFCGYNMADYFQHWLDSEKGKDPQKLPSIFFVNWFLKDQEGKFLWPGFGENSRVLKWIFQRVNAAVEAHKTAIGYMPKLKDFDIKGLNISKEIVEKLFKVDKIEWNREACELARYFELFKAKFPKTLQKELEALKERLQ